MDGVHVLVDISWCTGSTTCKPTLTPVSLYVHIYIYISLSLSSLMVAHICSSNTSGSQPVGRDPHRGSKGQQDRKAGLDHFRYLY